MHLYLFFVIIYDISILQNLYGTFLCGHQDDKQPLVDVDPS